MYGRGLQNTSGRWNQRVNKRVLKSVQFYTDSQKLIVLDFPITDQ